MYHKYLGAIYILQFRQNIPNSFFECLSDKILDGKGDEDEIESEKNEHSKKIIETNEQQDAEKIQKDSMPESNKAGNMNIGIVIYHFLPWKEPE